MKSLLNSVRLLGGMALLAFATLNLHAQANLMPGNAGGMNAVMQALLGTFSFTAKGDFHVYDSSMKETSSMPLELSMLDHKTRFEVNVAQMRSSHMPAEAANLLRKLGTSIAIVRPDLKETITIYPVLKAYFESPMDKVDEAEFLRQFNIQKTRLGEEAINKHPCEKTQVVLTDDKGQRQQALAWTASDLNNFPVQFQMQADQGQIVLIRFQSVNLTAPSPKVFDAPSGYTKCDNAQMNKKLEALLGQK